VLLRALILVTLVVAAAIAVNVSLLSLATAGHEPVGRLSPVAARTAPSQQPALRPAPAPPQPDDDEHDDADD
jgi:hypothetical protein